MVKNVYIYKKWCWRVSNSILGSKFWLVLKRTSALERLYTSGLLLQCVFIQWIIWSSSGDSRKYPFLPQKASIFIFIFIFTESISPCYLNSKMLSHLALRIAAVLNENWKIKQNLHLPILFQALRTPQDSIPNTCKLFMNCDSTMKSIVGKSWD